MTLETVRTPDDRFASLPDWPYEPYYVDDLPGYEGLRMHYVDEGPRDAPVFLCLHGLPTWAYLYRRMIPVFLETGATEYKAGIRAFPTLVPTSREMNGVEVSKRALKWWSTEFDGHSFMAIGENDPVLASVMAIIHGMIRGCPDPMPLPEAGHFVQEWGEQVARAALAEWKGE